jgi:hypothetical protein
MTQANPKYERGQSILTAIRLHVAGKCCVEPYNYYIQNYRMGQEIIVQFMNRHFLVGDIIFVITFSDLYDFFNINTLGISLMRCFAL